MKNTSLSIVALASVASALIAMPASAQELQRGETVLQRPRPEVEQLGVRAGSFVFLPRAELGTTYDSNVFLTENNTKSDWILVARPSLDVRSDFSAHALNFSVSADAGRYHEYTSENYTDYRVAAGGRYDVARETAVSADVFHRRLHEGRNDPDAEAGTVFGEPLAYYLSGGEVALTQGFNRIRTRLSAQAGYFDYKSVANDRDRWEYGTTLRVGYEMGTGFQPFVQGTYSWTNYRNTARDSDGWELVAGTTFDLTGLITGEVYAGYMTREYDTAALRDFSGLALGGQINWAVTQLTTISGRASRHVRETGAGTVTGVSSYTRTIGAIGVDHELLRTLLLNARLQWREDDFRTTNRTDNVYTAGLGATYLINRNFYLTGGYTYETRQSNVANTDYKDNLIFLRLGAQM